VNKHYELPNGFSLIICRVPGTLTTSCAMLVEAGPRYETVDKAGISHLLEHMLLRGTADRSGRQVQEWFDWAGGRVNAFTAKDYTCLFARVLNHNFAAALELVADLLRRPALRPAELEQEKRVVIQEIRSYEDAPAQQIYDLAFAALWPHCGQGRNTLGTVESVASLTAGDVADYHRCMYRPDRITIVIASALPEEELVEAVQRLSWPRPEGEPAPLQPVLQSPHVVAASRDTRQLHLCLAIAGCGAGDRDRYPLELLNGILGACPSSRVARNLRVTRGLAYVISSRVSCYRDVGVLTLYGGFDPANREAALDTLAAEMKRLREHGISESELQRVKELAKGMVAVAGEAVGDRVLAVAKHWLYRDEVYDVVAETRRIDAVTLEEVNSLAGRILRPAGTAVAAIGPFDPGEERLLEQWRRSL